MAIKQVLTPASRDLGEGFMVRRALPSPGQRMVGPFVFFDEMGPAHFAPGQGLDVRPHPHIGLATITYLFAGEITHRDSLGTVRSIAPGAVNWMVAGRGITHSERTGDAARTAGGPVWGIQTWIALPEAEEECDPAFDHHPASTLPTLMLDGARRTLIAGSAFGATSPVHVRSPMFYIDVDAAADATVHLPNEHRERAIYVAWGAILIDGVRCEAGQLVILDEAPAHFTTPEPARALLFGGAPIGPRLLEWNFVSARTERIAQAKADWRASRFPSVPGDTSFIPLPEDPPTVRYP